MNLYCFSDSADDFVGLISACPKGGEGKKKGEILLPNARHNLDTFAQGKEKSWRIVNYQILDESGAADWRGEKGKKK